MTRFPYQYVVLRCVPRPDREEFLNIGVVLHCPHFDFLDVAWRCSDPRLKAIDASLDLSAVRASMAFVEGVCRGEMRGGTAARQTLGQRFGFLKAPKSTVIQPGPVHGGLTDDPAISLAHLLERLVG